MIARLFARFRRQHVPAWRPGEGERVVLLSPGREITDPGEAEALGLTVDARRMRQQTDPRSST